MDENLTGNGEDSFAKELGKTAALSAASMVGAVVGVVVIGTVAGWISNRRKAKETTPEVPKTEED